MLISPMLWILWHWVNQEDKTIRSGKMPTISIWKIKKYHKKCLKTIDDEFW